MTFNTTLFQMRLVLWFTHFTQKQKQAAQIKSYLENREVFVGKIFCCHSVSFTVCRDGQSDDILAEWQQLSYLVKSRLDLSGPDHTLNHPI